MKNLFNKAFLSIKKFINKKVEYYSNLNNHTKAKLNSMFLVICIILFLSKTIWFDNGYIIFSDLDFGMYDSLYIKRIFGLFNDHFSSTNFFNLSRLLFISPFYLISLIFNKYIPSFLLKSIIVGILIFSGIGMYRLCKKILYKHFGDFALVASYYGLIIPAIFYAINPWVIFRIQHIFLLPGYACYPFVLSYFIDLFQQGIHEDKDYKNLSLSYILKKLKILFIINKIPFIRKNLFLNKFLNKSITIKKIILIDLTTCIKISFFICFGAAAIHYFFYYILTIMILSFAILLHNVYTTKKTIICLWQFLRKHIMLWTTVFFICSYWLVPYILSTLVGSIEPNNVNVVDTLDMFSRNSNIKNILYLVSYWWPMFDTSEYLDTSFWIGGGVFLFLIAYIVLYRFNMHFYVSLFSFATLFMIALATGVNSNLLDNVNIYIVTKIPIFGHIFRDPNKLVGPMAAYFCILLSFSIDRYMFLFKHNGYNFIVQTLFVLLLLSAHYIYYRPFNIIFSETYYSGIELPKEYKTISDKFYTNKGKILWSPSMDNMVLSNGISNYKWNKSNGIGEELNLVKPVGNFHFYSSKKFSIFPHEGNDGMVSYLYAYLQYLLDYTGAHNYSDLISWAGFNELGIHNDVYEQEKRQKFNYDTLVSNKDLNLHYKDKIFSLFKIPNPQDNLFGVNRTIFHTNDLYSFQYLLDEKKYLGIDSNNSALIWSQQKKIDTFLNDKRDYLVGDNKLDFIMPIIDNKYFIYPFEEINTGNPNIGWAKTLVKESEWFWILKVNNIKHQSFDYDYSHGIAYTNVSHKLTLPYNKIPQNKGNQVLFTKDILGGFFQSDNPDILKLTVFPKNEGGKGILQGHITKGFPGSNVWKVARSKPMDVSGLSGGFISIKSLVSGVNAGSINFKIYFFDKNDDEISVAYVSKPNNLSEFIESEMTCDTYVPSNTKTMRIDLLNTQDTIKDTYFWIHDFRIYNVSDYKADNILEVPIHEKSSNNKYHACIRAFTSPKGTDLLFETKSGYIPINLYSKEPKFQWIDIGEIEIDKEKTNLFPGDGLTIINSIVLIPENEYQKIISDNLKKFNGKQLDFTLAAPDYNNYSNFPVKNLDELKTFPNTINGTYQLLNKGYLRKNLDIIKEDTYKFSVTGYIPENGDISVYIKGPDQFLEVLQKKDNGVIVDRNLSNYQFKKNFKENNYFLSKEKIINNNWLVKKYSFPEIKLKPGSYEISILVDSKVKNRLDKRKLHFLTAEEITIPDHLKTPNEELMYAQDILPSYKTETKNDKIMLKSKKSKSKLWVIHSQNKVKVKKGELIGIRVNSNSSGLEELHGKLMWMDNNNVLYKSEYVPYDQKKNEFYLITEVPKNGYVQLCYFSQSDSKNDGLFSISNSELYFIDDFTKIEGTILYPTKLYNPSKIEKGKVRKKSFMRIFVENSKYLIYNECYNSLWKLIGFQNKDPMIVNFIHNAYPIEKDESKGFLMLIPTLFFAYAIFFIVSVSTLITGIVLSIYIKLKIIKNKL
ncbi:MAG: hypothetical protein ABF289_03830 [Clostridiales bacterium]